MYRILIVEDEELFLDAIKTVINVQPDMKVVEQSSNGLDALYKIDVVNVDIVITDIKMPKLNGIEFIKKAKLRYPHLKILILTTFNEQPYIIEGLAHGASGYILKEGDFHEIIHTIRNTLEGKITLPPEIAKQLSSYLLQSKQLLSDDVLPNWLDDDFTQRERDILIHLKNRLAIKEIASELSLSEGTIKNYLTLIYQKLNVKNRMEAIKLLNKKA
ncbi:two component transcriptional regulator, LuxR family [Gracilibacillus ureilyticus]|uniref:Two component transcriptional regulator, LuxR family n=1 Tax=Gracilibacillus ureilyticus TaxID=531814 RepID=A0A1H9QDP8_9BACI|nr:response regulator transcription factor [Gracilibacillus ureilyticus]SER58666.1 two component transcriptional regulator, LuxR family [Gracilibacillus ureilyticus]